jgi:GT2 family glycosyltransferase
VPDEPVVSVVIVTWNSAAVIGECLRSISASRSEVPLEVLVVDNSSSDDTIEVARAAFPSVKVVANADNRGLAAANNQGLRAAQGDYVLFSNPDVLYRPGAIDALVDLLRRRPRAAWAVAKLVREDGSVQTAVGDLPTLTTALLGRQWQQRRSGTTGFWWDGWAHDEEVAIGHGMEACYLVRRAAVDDIGLQDERFWLDWEGVDWSERAAEAGWEIWFCPSAEVVHLGGASLRQAQARWITRSHRSMYRYFAKRARPAARPALAVLFAARAALKLVAARAGVADYAASHPGATERTDERSAP